MMHSRAAEFARLPGLYHDLEELPCLSIWQPWAFLLAIGAKGFETRGWSTRYRGPIAIHAAQHWTVRMARQCYQEPFFTIMSRAGIRFPARCDSSWLPTLGLQFGAVLAVATLNDCLPTADVLPQLGPQERAFGDFTHDRFALLYTDVVRLDHAIPCRGKQGIFRLPPDVLRLVKRAGGLDL